MSYVLHRATIALHTPLGTPLAGDTLFGQLCWALRDAAGSDALGKALEGYTQGKPWLVVSDGFPAGCLPRPTLPQVFEPERKPEERKAAKKKAAATKSSAGDGGDELFAGYRMYRGESIYRRYRRIGVYEENGSIVRFTEH